MLKDQVKKHSKIIIACLYALTVSISFNFFWLPGRIYASGITGFSQLIVSVVESFLGISFSIPFLVLLMNLPLLIISWFVINRG